MNIQNDPSPKSNSEHITDTYTLPPRFFTIADEVQPIIKTAMYIVVLYCVYQCFQYSNLLASTCQDIFGFNAFLITDLVVCILAIVTITLVGIFIVQKIHYAKNPSNNKSIEIQPYLFSPRIVSHDSDDSNDNQSTPVISMLIAVLCFSIMLMPKPLIQNFTQYIISGDFEQINRQYHKKCIAKEQPFNRFR